MREFYTQALENCPTWMRAALLEEARRAGIQLEDELGRPNPQQLASED